MNWLAHAFLSEPDLECRLGNLLADMVKGKDRATMSPLFLRGVACHQSIDSFTDFHPVVERSKLRITPRFGRVAGILVDIFYDHFLSLSWEDYAPVPLNEFTAAETARTGPYQRRGNHRHRSPGVVWPGRGHRGGVG
jgi:acyl carrier protein phosphodiesterase